MEAVLFDYGGTLDGEGWQWFDRTLRLYREAGSTLPEAAIREAFSEADRVLDREAARKGYRLEPFLERHVGVQAEVLGEEARRISGRLVAGLAAVTREGWARSRTALARLAARKVRLGVVSNFHGNLDVLLDEAGLAPWLEVVVESIAVGLFKPDPAIFRLALRRLDLEPGRAMMVGDNFERDVRPAKTIGMQTAWLRQGSGPVPEPGIADRVIASLEEL